MSNLKVTQAVRSKGFVALTAVRSHRSREREIISHKVTMVWCLMVVLYLGAIVAANLLVARFGPSVTVLNAFLFIGLDLTSRDTLHDRWHGKGLRWKMTLLVGTGSVLSYLLNRDAGRIAFASFVAFAVAGFVDVVVYEWALRRGVGKMRRINESNVAAAAADSTLFPTIAFGEFLPLIVLGQFAAKVFGGAVWAWVLNAYSRR